MEEAIDVRRKGKLVESLWSRMLRKDIFKGVGRFVCKVDFSVNPVLALSNLIAETNVCNFSTGTVKP